ncbi:alpha/beta-hydrolase, partial [Thozetella sp. PMI_491]
RTYTVRIPPKYDSARAYPLIVAFHGHGGSSDQIHAISKWETFDTNGEYIVVYPQGVNNAWEGPSYADPTVDDLAFVDDLLTRFRNNYCIDNTRIYASGMSNGGGFVDLLACSSQGSNFAAFAMSSAALYADNLGAGPGDRACTPSRKQIPIMEIHGSADPVIPYNGGAVTGGTTPPILQWLNAWSTR